jgi:hypothetical protein
MSAADGDNLNPAHADPDRLLRTNRDGEKASVLEVMESGLNGEYADRLPGLHTLMRTGRDEDRFWATYLLAAWADPEALRQVAEWAAQPDAVPWGDVPISEHRFLGVDETFEILADAVHTSVLMYDATPERRTAQLAGVNALLRLAPTHWIGTKVAGTLALAGDLLDQALPELRDAVQRSVEVLRNDREPLRTHELQTLELLALLTEADDAAAASAAEQLIEPLTARRQLHSLAKVTQPPAGPRTTAVHRKVERVLMAEDATRSAADAVPDGDGPDQDADTGSSA